MLNGHNKVTETFPCWQHCNACKLQHKEKMAHTHTHRQTGPHSERVYVGSCISISLTGQCVRVCVSEGPFVYIPLTESVPKFAHVTNSIQTNKHTHTHMHIYICGESESCEAHENKRNEMGAGTRGARNRCWYSH